MIDTHAHIYSEEFDLDREDVIKRAKEAHIDHIILANVDVESFPKMIKTCLLYPEICLPSVGLHPTSVDSNFQQQLDILVKKISQYDFKAVGEIGLDLYWDQTFRQEQLEAFEQQLRWASELDLPVIIHVREAFEELHKTINKVKHLNLSGVIHSFSGNTTDVKRIKDAGNFLFGINGIVTFKKSSLDEVVKEIGLSHLVLETDAPYLAPVPLRGKRNEPSYMVKTGEKIAEILGCDYETIDQFTTKNAEKLFKIGI